MLFRSGGVSCRVGTNAIPILNLCRCTYDRFVNEQDKPVPSTSNCRCKFAKYHFGSSGRELFNFLYYIEHILV